MGFLLLESSSKRIIKSAEDQLLHTGKLIEVQIQEYIDELITDLLFLDSNPVLKNYLQGQSSKNYELLNEEFLSLLTANGDYEQIRFLDSEDGKELVRVDRRNGKPVITPIDQLQVKKNRPYFLSAIQLDSNEIYFSPIDLNKEFGTISKPYTPTLRIAKPIHFQGVKRGIIVINADLTKLFEKLNKSVESAFNLRIFNQDGYYLLHEEKDSTFMFEFGASPPQITMSENSISGVVERDENELYSSHIVAIPEMRYKTYYHVIADKSELLSPYNSWIEQSIYRILFIVFIFTVVAFLILRSQFKNLQKLTKSIKEFPKNRKVTELPSKRNDEIGALAKSFEEMATIINEQIDSIEAERQKAEQAEKSKSNFIENITHEIRNPLQSIIGLSTILEQNNPNSNQIDILNSIRLNTTNLNALVNSILDYQNILKGNLELQRQYTNLKSLVEELVLGISYTAHQKSVDVQTQIDESLASVEANIDRLRISQILNNLIYNAITHTKENGTIRIELRQVRKQNTTEDGAILKFQVSDDGIGMSEDEIHRIKERYYTKSNDVLSSNYGLGLTIVNELLNLMNSELHIESEQNVGSSFSFEVVTPTRLAIVPKTSKGVVENNSLQGKKVLILEDDEQVINLYKHFFKESIVTVLSNFNALDSNLDELDLVITDFYLRNTKLSDYLISIKNIMSESTALVVVTGQDVNIGQIKSVFPEVVLLSKPLAKEYLFDGMFKAMVYARFGIPYTNIVKRDYDNDASKYMKAFQLLLTEWQVYTDRLVVNIRNRNVEGLEEVLHKLNNTLRRLQLFRLESYLFTIKEDLTIERFDSELVCVEVTEIMHVYYNTISSSMD